MLLEIGGLVLLGVVAGIMGGHLGIGGALVITPILLPLSAAHGIPEDVRYPLVFSSTLLAILGTAISAGTSYARAGRVHWGAFKVISITGVLFSLLGSITASHSSPELLRNVFAIFAVASAIVLASPLKTHGGGEFHFHIFPFVVLGCVTGFVSAFIGVAGGVIMVPAMLLLIKVPAELTVGTSSIVGVVTSAVGVIGYIISGWNVPNLPELTIGYVHLGYALPIAAGALIGGPIGSKINRGSSVKIFRFLFALYLVIVAVRMFLK